MKRGGRSSKKSKSTRLVSTTVYNDNKVDKSNDPCVCGPNFYAKVLGPTADETILIGLQTFMGLCEECPPQGDNTEVTALEVTEELEEEEEDISEKEFDEEEINEEDDISTPTRATSYMSQISIKESEKPERVPGISQTEFEIVHGSSQTEYNVTNTFSQTQAPSVKSVHLQVEHSDIPRAPSTKSLHVHTKHSDIEVKSTHLPVKHSDTSLPHDVASPEKCSCCCPLSTSLAPSVKDSHIATCECYTPPTTQPDCCNCVESPVEHQSHSHDRNHGHNHDYNRDHIHEHTQDHVRGHKHSRTHVHSREHSHGSSAHHHPKDTKSNHIGKSHSLRSLKGSSDTCCCTSGGGEKNRHKRRRHVPVTKSCSCSCSACRKMKCKSIHRRSCVRASPSCKCQSTHSTKCSVRRLRSSESHHHSQAEVDCNCCVSTSSTGYEEIEICSESCQEDTHSETICPSQMVHTSEPTIRYAITKITKFSSFTTFEVMKSTKRRPKVIPKSLEGVFVLKNCRR